jgi:hypothetical protein
MKVTKVHDQKSSDQKDLPAGHPVVVGTDEPACQMVRHSQDPDQSSQDHSSRDRSSQDRSSQDRSSQDRSSQDRSSQDRSSQVGRKIHRRLLMDRSRALEALCSIHAAHRREELPLVRRPVG